MQTTAHTRSAIAVSPVSPVAPRFAQPMAHAFLPKPTYLGGKQIVQVGAIGLEMKT